MTKKLINKEDAKRVIGEITEPGRMFTRQELIDALVKRCGYLLEEAKEKIYKIFPPLD